MPLLFFFPPRSSARLRHLGLFIVREIRRNGSLFFPPVRVMKKHGPILCLLPDPFPLIEICSSSKARADRRLFFFTQLEPGSNLFPPPAGTAVFLCRPNSLFLLRDSQEGRFLKG